MLDVNNRFAALKVEDDEEESSVSKGAESNQNQSNSAAKKKNKKKKKESDEVIACVFCFVSQHMVNKAVSFVHFLSLSPFFLTLS